MPVTASSFNKWLAGVGLPDATSELSRLLGMKRTTLHNQRGRGNVAATTIIAAARAARINPLDALASFEPYVALLEERKPVTNAELISQVSHVDALVHLLSRIRADFAQILGVVPLTAIPSEDSVRNWIDAIDPGDLRRHVAAEGGLALSNLSAQLTENRLNPELAIIASRFAGVSSTSGLVVSGLVTPTEAGWPLYGRENALSEINDLELLDLVTHRLATLHRQTKKRVEAEEAAADYLETLG